MCARKSLQIADGWLVGTPSVTTPLGAEGMCVPGSPEWGGVIAGSDDGVVAAAAALYQDETAFAAHQQSGLTALQTLFDRRTHTSALGSAIRYKTRGCLCHCC